jgi:GNAT superfamily N-acetyltransferase
MSKALLSSEIGQLARLIDRTNPAEIHCQADGWVLRSTDGVDQLANNSVLPNGAAGSFSMEEKVKRAESFYEHRKQPVAFQITPVIEPTELDQYLSNRGYSIRGLERVMIADPAKVLEVTGRGEVVQLDETVNKAWYNAVWPHLKGKPEQFARMDMVDRIEATHRFASMTMDQNIAAVGIGIADQGWLGIAMLQTQERHRRHGLASGVIGALTNWGRQQGVEKVYLTVDNANQAGVGLLDHCGFETAFIIHYRVRD